MYVVVMAAVVHHRHAHVAPAAQRPAAPRQQSPVSDGMKNVNVVLFATAFIFFSGSVLFFAHQRFFRAAIKCEQPVVDLGTVIRGDEARFEFRIENVGRCALMIHAVTPTCGACIRVSRFPHGAIASGDYGEIQLELLTADLRGPVVKSVVVASNDPAQPKAILRVRAVIAERESIPDSPAQ
jgi:hypothetical protein